VSGLARPWLRWTAAARGAADPDERCDPVRPQRRRRDVRPSWAAGLTHAVAVDPTSVGNRLYRGHVQSTAACPLRSHPGAIPRTWVGRDLIQTRLQSLYTNHAPLVGRCDLLIGSTGLGKSALLEWVSQAAAQDGRPVVRVTVSGPTAAAAGLGAAISDAVNRLRAARSIVAKATQVVRRVPIRITTPWTEYVERAESPATSALAAALLELDTLARELDAPALLVLDEVHALDADSAEALVYSLVRDNESIVQVIAAGLTSAYDKLVLNTMMTIAPRMFNAIELDLLEPEDSCRLLRDTAALAGVTWSNRVVEAAAQAAGGSPYELQTIGEYLWGLHGEAELLEAIESYAEDRNRNMLRLVGRLPRPAVGLLLSVSNRGPDGVPLLHARGSAASDDEFFSSLDTLERVGLVNVDPEQRVRVTAGPEVVAQVLELRIELEALESGPDNDRPSSD